MILLSNIDPNSTPFIDAFGISVSSTQFSASSSNMCFLITDLRNEASVNISLANLNLFNISLPTNDLIIYRGSPLHFSSLNITSSKFNQILSTNSFASSLNNSISINGFALINSECVTCFLFNLPFPFTFNLTNHGS